MTETATAIIVALIAATPPSIIAYAALRQSRKNADSTHKTQKATEELKTLVNGPLGVTMEVAATALEHVARLLPHDQDALLEAKSARKMADEHRHAQAAVTAAREMTALAKQQVIADYLQEQVSKK